VITKNLVIFYFDTVHTHVSLRHAANPLTTPFLQWYRGKALIVIHGHLPAAAAFNPGKKE
jgi:hypothetical protein